MVQNDQVDRTYLVIKQFMEQNKDLQSPEDRHLLKEKLNDALFKPSELEAVNEEFTLKNLNGNLILFNLYSKWLLLIKLNPVA